MAEVVNPRMPTKPSRDGWRTKVRKLQQPPAYHLRNPRATLCRPPDPPNSKLGRGVKRKTVCCTCEHFVRSRAPPQPPTTLILGVRGFGEGGFVKLPGLLERLRYLQTFVLQQSCCQGRRCSLSVLLCSWGPRWPPPKAGVSRSMLLRGFGPGPLRALPQGLSHTGGHLGADEVAGAPRNTHPTRSDNEGPSGLPGRNRQI